MAVAVKEYLSSMKSVSSSIKTASDKQTESDLKLQSLLSQLIEAISYANSVDFRQKTLNQQAPGTADKGETGRQVLENMKAQEKLVRQLADGQKLSNEQTKELNATINKFYELIGAQEVNYKQFAANLEKFALQDLPEAVQTRLINDSRDAHMIGQEQKNGEGVILPILKRMRNLLEDSAENTKQFTKKLFVSLDGFKAGLLSAFEDLAEKIEKGGIGGLLDNIANLINGIGIAWMTFDGMFKEGNFKWGQAFKQFDNIKTMLKAFKEVGGLSAGIGKSIKTAQNSIKSIQSIFKTFGRLPKFIEKLGLGKGLGAVTKSIGKSIGKGLGKQALKKIPLIGTAMSIWMAIERWNKKDYLGAFLEIGSGIAAIFPGVGTLISIGIDLVNLERDTGMLGKSKFGQSVQNAVKAIPENFIMMIPGIGTIYGLAKSIGLFQKGDKKEGLKMLGKSIASIIPGGAMIVDLLYKLMDLKFDLKPKSNSQPVGNTPETTELINKVNTKPNAKYKIKRQKPGTSGTKVEDFEWEEQRGFSDISPVPASMQLGAGNDSTFGDNLAQAAIARGGRTTRSGGYCALAVGDAFAKVVGEKEASKYRGNAWTWINKLKGMGSKWFNNAGIAKNNRELSRIPAGSIAVWDKQPAHPYGHIEIADGKGHLISDFKRPANLGLYRSNPAGIKPMIFTPKDKPMPKLTGINNPFGQDETSSAGDVFEGEVSAEEAPMTFEGLMDAFNKFNESLVEGVEPTQTATVTPDKSTPSATTEQLTAGTPAAATATATSTTAAKATSAPPTSTVAPAQQVTQAVQSDAPPGEMDTEIRDTDLALLNSILFT